MNFTTAVLVPVLLAYLIVIGFVAMFRYLRPHNDLYEALAEHRARRRAAHREERREARAARRQARRETRR